MASAVLCDLLQNTCREQKLVCMLRCGFCAIFRMHAKIIGDVVFVHDDCNGADYLQKREEVG